MADGSLPKFRTQWLGMKFGKLTVIEFSHRQKGRMIFRCRCDCGGEKLVGAGNLVHRNQVHCGCSPRHRGIIAAPKVVPTAKTCRVCGVERPVADFAPRPVSRDLHESRCRPCKFERARNTLVTPEKRADKNERAAARKQAIKQATPRWANKKKIRAIYRSAVTKMLETGIEYDVDHIIPIKGKTCCGLHVEYNLEVVTATYNRRKRNKFEPYVVGIIDASSSAIRTG